MEKNLLFKKSVLLLLTVSCLSAAVTAQDKKPVPPGTQAAPPAAPPAPPKPGPKPYKDVITDKAVSRKGLFTVHKVDDKWFFEIGDSLLGRDILVVNRISKAPIDTRAGFTGFAGDEINENVIRFEKGPNNKVFLTLAGGGAVFRLFDGLESVESHNSVFVGPNVNMVRQVEAVWVGGVSRIAGSNN